MSIKIHCRPASITVREFHWPTIEVGRRTQPERPHLGSKTSLAPGAACDEQRAPKEQSESELRRRCEEAYQRGAEEARAEFEAEREAALQPALERLTQSLQNITAYRSLIHQQAESEIVRLAIAIARRVIHRELTLDPDSIQGLVKAALQKLQSREIQRVRLHKAQEEVVRECLLKGFPGTSIQIVVDPALQLGDVFFETTQGDLDASMDTQLREIERGFADRLEIS
jgi:flagellar assembly protein FliH